MAQHLHSNSRSAPHTPMACSLSVVEGVAHSLSLVEGVALSLVEGVPHSLVEDVAFQESSS